MRIISALLVFLLVGCDGLFNEVSDAEYVSRAQVFLDEGKLKSASIELKNALASNPGNAQARWLLGRLYVEIGNGLAAEKELNRARNLGVNDDSVLPLLLRAMLLQRNYAGVLEQDFGSIASDKAAAELMASRGLAYLYQKKMDKAEQELDAALLRGADLPYVLTARAHLSVAKGNREEARSYLERALLQDNSYALAWSLIGDLTPVKDGEKAIEAFSKAIENRFNNAADLLKRALVFIQLKNYEKAQNDLNQLKARFPNNMKANYVQGVLYFLQKRLPEAQETLEQVLKSNSDEIQAVFYLGATQFLQGNYEQAKNYLSRFVTAAPHSFPGRKLLAQIRLRDREYVKAVALMRPVVKTNPEDIVALNILATALISQGKADEAVELLERVVKLQPEEAEARMRLGVGLLAKGEKRQGIENLEHAIEIDSQFQQVDILLVLNYLKENDIKKALEAAKSFVSRQPENVVAYNMLGMAYLAAKQEEEAKHSFQAAKKLAPGDPGSSQQLAALALKNKAPEKARAYLQDVLKQHPDHLRTLLALAALEASQGKKEAMEIVLKDAIAAHPEAVQPRVLLAQEYLERGKTEQARVVLGDMPNKHRSNPGVLATFGGVQLASGEFAAAKFTFQQLVNLQPKVAQAHYLLARAYDGLNDQKGLKTELEQTLALAPEHLLAKMALTRLLMAKGDIDSAKEQLASLKKFAGDNPEVLILEADVLTKSGDTDQALVSYRKLFAAEPNTATLIALAGHQWAMGDRDGAILQLEQWEKDHPDDISPKLALANNYLGMGRQDDAARLYQQVLMLAENNLLALNNLAWHFRESDPKKALAYAERATAVAPESTMVMDTLALILLEKGDVRKAQRIIDRAREKMPEDRTLHYHQALILEKAVGAQAAQKVLQELLSNEEEFPERKEAELALERISTSLMK